jgi:hypothetical protein
MFQIAADYDRKARQAELSSLNSVGAAKANRQM